MRTWQAKVGIVIAMMLLGGVGLAGVADDFKDAANRDGCEAIPYSSERSSCNTASREVDDWCKSSSRKWSCDDLDPSGINRNIDNVNAKITELKKEKDELESRRNNAKDDGERRDLESKIKDKKDQIDGLQAKVEAWKKQLDGEKSMAKDRQEIGERCVTNRLAVQKIFANVKTRVQGESDPEAKQYVSKLVDKYTAAEKGHQEAIDITKRGIEKCKNAR